MKRLPLLLLLLSALPAGAFAQQEMTGIRKQEPFVQQHELRLTAGAYPLLTNLDRWSTCTDADFSFDRPHRGAVYTSGAWSLSYDYRFKKWFDLGATVSYYGEYTDLYSSDGWSPVRRDRTHYISVMPVVGFTWLNKNWVRMYSSFGLGATIEHGRRYYDDRPYRDVLVALQFTPIGISVGRSLFGFAEIGVGSQGVLMMGVGYKFKSKNRSAK